MAVSTGASPRGGSEAVERCGSTGHIRRIVAGLVGRRSRSPMPGQGRTTQPTTQPTALLVASSGGHLNELWALCHQWPGLERRWVTFDTPDARHRLAGEHVFHAAHPTNRNVPNLARNTVIALRLIRRERPEVVVTTGAGVAVPFAYAARLWRIPVIFVESVARVSDLSLSARLCAPVVDRLFVQWPEQVGLHRKAEYGGQVL